MKRVSATFGILALLSAAPALAANSHGNDVRSAAPAPSAPATTAKADDGQQLKAQLKEQWANLKDKQKDERDHLKVQQKDQRDKLKADQKQERDKLKVAQRDQWQKLRAQQAEADSGSEAPQRGKGETTSVRR